jgi:hypothetical protein
VLGCDSEEEAEPSIKVLNRAAGFLRSSCADGTMRSVPRLRFLFDTSVGRGRDLEALIDRATAADAAQLHAPTRRTEAIRIRGPPTTKSGRADGVGAAAVGPCPGILLLDKPVGLSSNQALQRAKRLFGAAKAGHTGSLDPLATGVLPLCFGEATKFSQYLLDADKVYESTLRPRREHGYGRCGGRA